LIDSRNSIYFIHEDFIEFYEILLVPKPYSVLEEGINEGPLASKHITYKTMPLEIKLKGHNNLFVIKTLTNLVMIELL